MSSPRAEFFAESRRKLEAYYLAPGADAYQQSGRSGGAARWEQTRRPIADLVDRDGDFLDVGCANGLLLESLISWCAERGLRLRPHGIDFIPGLIELARRRLGSQAQLAVANAFHWDPPRRYDYVRTNLEYVPRDDHVEFVKRMQRAVSADGRLIACHYHNADERPIDVVRVLARAGLPVSGERRIDGVSLAWSDGQERSVSARR